MYAVCRIEKHKRSGTTKVEGHNHRKQGMEDTYKHAKESRDWFALDDKNDWLLKPDFDTSLDERITRRIEESGAKENKRSVVAVELMLSASPEYFRPDKPYEAGYYQEDKMLAWRDKALEFVQNKYGAENVVDAVLHLDESTPHMHIVVVPIRDKTIQKRRTKKQIEAEEAGESYTKSVLDAKNMFDKKGLETLQTEYAASLEELGLKRGLRKSTATHEDTKAFYAAVEEAAAAMKKIPKLKPMSLEDPGVFNRAEKLKAQENKINGYIKSLVSRYTNVLNKARRAIKRLEYKLARTERALNNERAANRDIMAVGGPTKLVQAITELKQANTSLESSLRSERELRAAEEKKTKALEQENRELIAEQRKAAALERIKHRAKSKLER